MPKYQCPECEAVLRRENAVPEGKKIKCPKCETIFKAVPMRDAAAAPADVKKQAKAAPKNAPPDGDEEEGGAYTIADDPEEKAEKGGKKKKKKDEVNYGSLRDKFEKSLRGPAMARLVKLSNGMLMIGVISIILAVAGFIVKLWPFVFSDETPKGRELSYQIGYMVGSVFAAAYGGCICFSASKMQELASYKWSIAGAILTLILGLLNTIVGFLGVAVAFIALTGEKPEPPAPPADCKSFEGTITDTTKTQLSITTNDKKDLTFQYDEARTKFRNGVKPAKMRDVREGKAVRIYAKKESETSADEVVVNPDDDGDDTFTLTFQMLLNLGVLAFGAFGLSISGKSLMRLKEEDIKGAYEETREMVEY